MGGCDGVRMHSTVEIFDPRMNSWTLGESMNNSRGYSGAVVVGGRLYVIGGLKEKHDILETVCKTSMLPFYISDHSLNISSFNLIIYLHK